MRYLVVVCLAVVIGSAVSQHQIPQFQQSQQFHQPQFSGHQQSSFAAPPPQHQQSFAPAPQQSYHQPKPQSFAPFNAGSAATSRPVALQPAIAVVKSVSPDGAYGFGFQTHDGQLRAESVGSDGTIRGAYSYTAPDGQKIAVQYTAGKDGFVIDPPAGGASAPQPQAQSHQFNPQPQQHQPRFVPPPLPKHLPPPPQPAYRPPPPPQQSYQPPQQSYQPPQQSYQPHQQSFQPQAPPNYDYEDDAISSQQSTPKPAYGLASQYAYGSNAQSLQSLQQLLTNFHKV